MIWLTGQKSAQVLGPDDQVGRSYPNVYRERTICRIPSLGPKTELARAEGQKQVQPSSSRGQGSEGGTSDAQVSDGQDSNNVEANDGRSARLERQAKQLRTKDTSCKSTENPRKRKGGVESADLPVGRAR